MAPPWLVHRAAGVAPSRTCLAYPRVGGIPHPCRGPVQKREFQRAVWQPQQAWMARVHTAGIEKRFTRCREKRLSRLVGDTRFDPPVVRCAAAIFTPFRKYPSRSVRVKIVFLRAAGVVFDGHSRALQDAGTTRPPRPSISRAELSDAIAIGMVVAPANTKRGQNWCDRPTKPEGTTHHVPLRSFRVGSSF